MAENAIDLCLASEVAADLGVTSDATVQRMVTAASRAIARYCGRTLEKGTALVEYPEGYGRPLLLLDRAPILSITSITELGGTVASTDYTIEGRLAESGTVYRRYGAWLRTARWEGNVAQAFGQHQGTSDGIVVTYTAGYVTPGQHALDALTYATVTVPEDLQEAARIAANAFYRRRSGRDPNLAAEAIGDWSVQYFKGPGEAEPLPADARALLGPYLSLRAS